MQKGYTKAILATGISMVLLLVAARGSASAPARIAADPGPKIQAVFVLDTTGSMSGLISAAKEKIWSIASSMAQARPTPEISIGLLAYRDRGDEYITARTDLSRDLDAVYGTLMDYSAEGGGDGPESVNQGLHEAVTMMSWDDDPGTYKVIFLVGDFPPHMDYDDDVPYTASCKSAAKKGIVINAIQCGNNGGTTPIWQEIARLSDGDYFQVEQGGGAVIATTPYDEELARLGRELDETRLFYGDRAAKKKSARKSKLSRTISGKASAAANARRAAFNASEAGADNFLASNELIGDLAAGKVKLDDLGESELPEDLQKVSAKERVLIVKLKVKSRKAIKKKIAALSKKRQSHIQKELEASEDGGKGALSQKMYDSVRKQAAKRKISFESDMAAH